MPMLDHLSANFPQRKGVRKLPVQERALRTIDTIFQATAQIVESEGENGLTTNKIAQLSGFSIGTLYQYFPSKEAILVAMISRARRRVMDDLQTIALQAVQEQRGVEIVVRDFIRILIKSFGSGSVYKRAMIRLAWRMDQHENLVQALREASDRNALLLSQIKDPTLRPPTPALMFVISRSVIGVIRSASLENSLMLDTSEFEDELVRMVCALLKT